MMRLVRDLARSTPLRLALALLALFALVSLLSLWASYIVSQRSFLQTMREDLTQDMAGFRAAPTSLALARLVEAEAEATDPERMVLSYVAPTRRHFGNAMIARDADGYHILTGIPDNPRIKGRFMALTASMKGGQLTIARSLADVEALRNVYLRILLLSLVPTVLIGLSGGLYMARRSAKRVRSINETLDRLTGGGLEARVVPGLGWPADLAEIGRKVDAMAEAQESSVAALRQVSSDIAHDLKTPIQRVAVYLSDLSEREVSDTVSQDLLDKAKAELDGIVGVFHALLQIAQIETGSPKAGFKSVDLVELCATFRDLYEPAAAEAGHTLTFMHEGTGRVEVLGDRGLLGQVLANLIENAIRHTQPDARITLSLTQELGHPVVSVADNGPGVPPDERDLVLRRLYRRDQSRSTPGAGLGLSLVSSIAALHAAEVTLEDNAPGLRVSLRFPAAR